MAHWELSQPSLYVEAARLTWYGGSAPVLRANKGPRCLGDSVQIVDRVVTLRLGLQLTMWR